MLVDFNSSVIDPNYNGHTCSNFCCRRAEATGPESWTFPFHLSHPICANNTTQFPCTRWVPCDVSDRMTPVIVSVALSAPLFLYICAAFIYFRRILTRTETAITIVVQMIVFWLSLVVLYDLQNWASQTEADKILASTYNSAEISGHENDWIWWGKLVSYHVARSSTLYAQLSVSCIVDTIELYNTQYERNPDTPTKLYFMALYSIFIICDLLAFLIITPSNHELLSYGNAGHSFKIRGDTLCGVSIACLIALCILSGLMYYFIPKQSDDTFPITSSSQSHSSMDYDILQRVRLLPH